MSSPIRSSNAPRRNTREQGRVLLVTDEVKAKALTGELEEAGIAVVGVTSGAAALVSLHRVRPDVVVADLGLKGLSTNELARALSQSKEQVFLIFIGEADANFSLRSVAMELGAFDYFSLPVEMDWLKQRINHLVKLIHDLDHLRAEADRYYLTDLMNRRRFRIALGQEIERWRRYKTPSS